VVRYFPALGFPREALLYLWDNPTPDDPRAFQEEATITLVDNVCIVKS